MSRFDSLDRNMPILIVDDATPMRRVVRKCLRTLGFKNIVEAEDSKGALERLKSEQVQFIISDWNLPELDGQALMDALKGNAQYKKIPLLAVTAETQKEEALKSIKSEKPCLIVKPFTAEILQTKMEALFEEIEK